MTKFFTYGVPKVDCDESTSYKVLSLRSRHEIREKYVSTFSFIYYKLFHTNVISMSEIYSNKSK